MSIYAIGDVQGCYEPLQRLLEKIDFSPENDTLWFVGDLVNRGPQSLETLRFIKNLGTAAISVLGNHDLHLLAVATQHHKPKNQDTLDDILHANDRDELLDWLRHRPLLHHDDNLQITLVHAGILPQWSLAEAQQYASEVENVLQSADGETLLQQLYGNEPACWSDNLQGLARWRFIINAFTRMRYLTQEGCLELSAKMPLADAPAALIPWYHFSGRVMVQQTIVFGHWAALNGITDNPYAINIDTGCVWGNRLTAMVLHTKTRISIA
jgi:bis(5'-nucleosyl)-tetraphosphatase (symmetrical)